MEIPAGSGYIGGMQKEELDQKMKDLADASLRLLEERTGLALRGLTAKEINRRVKAWEKAQKAPK